MKTSTLVLSLVLVCIAVTFADAGRWRVRRHCRTVDCCQQPSTTLAKKHYPRIVKLVFLTKYRTLGDRQRLERAKAFAEKAIEVCSNFPHATGDGYDELCKQNCENERDALMAACMALPDPDPEECEELVNDWIEFCKDLCDTVLP